MGVKRNFNYKREGFLLIPTEEELEIMQEIELNRRRRLSEHKSNIKDPVLMVLKGHLLVEEMMDQIIIHHCRDPEIFLNAQFSFSNKIALCQALVGPLFLDKLVEMLKSFNSLRNQLAHKLDSEKLEVKMWAFIQFVHKQEPNNLGRQEKDVLDFLESAISSLFAMFSCVEVIIRTGKLPHYKVQGINPISRKDFSKDCFTKRIADCVILTHDNKILMQQRPDNWKTCAGALNIFGGHVEENETVLQGLIRELKEELGAKIKPEDVIFIGAVTEEETNHTEIIHIYFWHDIEGTITGCYEAEDVRYDSIEEALAHPKIMNYAKWALMTSRKCDLLKN